MEITFLKFSISLNLIILFLSVQNVFACQCYGFDTPYEAYKEADAVFVGKVVSIKDSAGQEIIKNNLASEKDYRRDEGNVEYNHFAVQEWFKGEKTSEVIVRTDINMCQHGFDVGSNVLIYAYKSHSSKTLWTNIYCSRTTWIDSAQPDISFLRERLANKSEPRIYGAVYFGQSYAPKEYLEKIKIIAQKGKRKFIAFTDKNGLYRFYKLPDGKYKIYPELPKKYVLDWSYNFLKEINLRKNVEKGRDYFKSYGPSAYADFAVRWNNKISGRVLDAEGKSLNRATIRLLQPTEISDKPFNEEEKIGESLDWENRNSNWRKYEKIGKTPGKYILALEVFAPFASGEQKLRMYYPQALTSDKAEIIDIGQTTQSNVDLKLPDGFYVREIEGTFLWGSGIAIEDGWVSIEKMENSDDPNNVVYESKRTNKGYFKFQVFENAEYWIHGKFDHQRAKPIKIKVGKTNEPIKLCITLIKGYKPENCSNN